MATTSTVTVAAERARPNDCSIVTTRDASTVLGRAVRSPGDPASAAKCDSDDARVTEPDR